jgi:hypothetical protein
MRDIDHKLINQIKHAHAKVTDKVMALMLCCGVPSNEIHHCFLGTYDDEYILWGKTGFHITCDWDQDSRVTCEAEPGEFIETSGAAPMWIRRVTQFHKDIGKAGIVQ